MNLEDHPHKLALENTMYTVKCLDRNMYWAPHSFGYVSNRLDAGVYTEEEAEEIVENAAIGKGRGAEMEKV